MLKLGDLRLQQCQGGPHITVLLQMLLSMPRDLLHFFQVSAGRSLMNCGPVKKNAHETPPSTHVWLLLSFVFKFGDLDFQSFERRSNIAMFSQVLLSFMHQFFHLIQISPCDAAMDGYSIEWNDSHGHASFRCVDFLLLNSC